jgi:beta-glucosidase
MKLLLIAAFAAAAASPAIAQDAHAGHAGHADHAAPAAKATTRLNLDTPVETVMADASGKAVLEAALPGIGAHEHYEHFKAMGLRQIAGMAPAQLTPEVLAKIESGLAAIK